MQLKKIYLFIYIILIAVNAFPSVPPDNEKNCGSLYGRVFDQETGEPISGITVFLPEITRSGFTHEDGHFYIPALPIGVYTLQTFRIGYQNVLLNINIDRCDTNYVEFRMKISPLNMESIVVTSQGDKTFDVLTAPPVRVEGKKLRQQLGKTIAETISDEPGLDLRSMGPAPARPILRGLGGDRLLILEDGGRTGDLSATSADHAVVIEPITAERIEVIRGPEALMFGSSTLAGVINVGRGYIPTTNWGHLHATATYQGETVTNGSSGGASISLPLGPLSLRLDGSFRSAGNLSTPTGTLDNTSIHTQNGAIGLSLVKSWGFIGIAGSYYQSDYGIPGGFVGAHPYGVDIDLERKHLEAKSQIFFRNPALRQLEINASYSRYHHKEFESSGILGIEFGLLTYNFSMITRLKPFRIFQNGAIGIWGEYRDHAAGGLSFTPPTTEQTLAGFLYQEAVSGPFAFQGALRFDAKQVTPEFEKISSRIGYIRERRFANFSGSIKGLYNFHPSYHAGFSVMRSFRAPGIEELFSEGPHLAAYSFEIGNPELGNETGIGIDLFLHYSGNRGKAEITAFRNDISGYIFPRNTGQLNYRTLLPTYQFSGLNAIMTGGEFLFEYEILNSLAFSTTLSYVHGELSDSGDPLPWMPPFGGAFELRYTRNKLTLGTTVRTAADQERPGEFEQRTAGYTVTDVFAQYFFSISNYLNTVDLIIENIADTEYRKHLSRVKSIMPEPGRNFKLLYRIYF